MSDEFAMSLLVCAIGMGMGGNTVFAMNLACDMGSRLAPAVLAIKDKTDNDWQYCIMAPCIAPLLD
jgi:glycerol uptake facilitator-like aquaporin